jgi:peptide methionine sulfoxide reductase msrA/msrB
MKLLATLMIASILMSSECQSNYQSIEQNNENIKNINSMKYNPLTEEEANVILHKGTERPFTGIYYKYDESGTYLCKQCNTPLYRSQDKFDSGCGWPSFDDEIEGAVKRIPDVDGHRTEIVCAVCGAHLGHVFMGEGFTEKNTRHCVNSISLNFKSSEIESKIDTAIFASGCFWGTEYWMVKQKGVLSTDVGYIGGHKENPGYEEVCTGKTGHAEAVKVVYDPSIISYEDLTKIFFETHDPSQEGGQGPDIGDQYRSEIFYLSDSQKSTAEKVIKQLQNNGYKVVTKLTKAGTFWKAENYHQDYYEHKGTKPYCHFYTKKF